METSSPPESPPESEEDQRESLEEQTSGESQESSLLGCPYAAAES